MSPDPSPDLVATPDPHAADRRLVDRLLAGSDEAWHELVSRFQRLVYTIAIQDFRLQPADADDVHQDVWLRLAQRNYAALRAWKAEGPLSAYIRTVTIRIAIDHVRAGRLSASLGESRGSTRGEQQTATTGDSGQPPTDPIDPQPSPEGEAERTELLAMLRAVAADVLNERDCSLVERWLQGHTYKQMAAALGMTVTNVGVAKDRAVKKVADEVRRRHPDLYDVS